MKGIERFELTLFSLLWIIRDDAIDRINFSRQRLAHIGNDLIFVLLAGKPNWFGGVLEQIDHGRAAELKSVSVNKAAERSHIVQVDVYVEPAQEACARGDVQTLKVEK